MIVSANRNPLTFGVDASLTEYEMNYNGVKVLITGADGFIGSHLTEELVRQGADVRALVQYDSFGGNGWLDDIDEHLRSSVDIRRGDVRDAGFIDRIAEGREIIFHLAALIAIPYSYDAPQSYVDVNVSGTLNILKAARQYNVSRVVHTSTSEVYGTAQFSPISEAHPLVAQSPYSASKIGADMMATAFARSFDLPTVILRPFNTCGPRQSERAVLPTVIRQALDPDCKTILIGDVSPVRDFNYVHDIAAAFAFAGGSSELSFGVPYNAGSGSSVTVGEAIELIRELCGTNKAVETDQTRYRPQNSEVFELLADANAFSQATGWTSSITLRDGLNRTIDWWRTQIARGELRRDHGNLL